MVRCFGYYSGWCGLNDNCKAEVASTQFATLFTVPASAFVRLLTSCGFLLGNKKLSGSRKLLQVRNRSLNEWIS